MPDMQQACVEVDIGLCESQKLRPAGRQDTEGARQRLKLRPEPAMSVLAATRRKLAGNVYPRLGRAPVAQISGAQSARTGDQIRPSGRLRAVGIDRLPALVSNDARDSTPIQCPFEQCNRAQFPP